MFQLIRMFCPAFCSTFCIALAFGFSVFAGPNADAQTAEQIATPFPQSWVNDQTDTLSDLQRKLIDDLCRDVQTQYNRQLAVVVIGSANGRDHRRYATQIFNHWRVGAGYKNQGVLIFAAMEDRAAEIILGVGIDNAATVVAAQSIMDNVIVPKFKANEAGSAIYEGVHACAKRIIGVGKLEVASELPSIPAEQPIVTAEMPLEQQKSGVKGSAESMIAGSENETAAGSVDGPAGANNGEQTNPSPSLAAEPLATRLADRDLFQPVTVPLPALATRPTPVNRGRPQARRKPSYLPWLLGLGGVGALATFFGTRHYLRYRGRTCDVCRLDRVLLTEIQDDDFLSQPQRVEEKIGSVDYDVWACLECEDVLKLRYGRWFTRYSNCPECHFVTRFKITETVIPATTRTGGVVRVKEFCKNCEYHHTYTYATPRIQKSSSGSSSGGFSSGGGSRSGGFSSGGGASGRW